MKPKIQNAQEKSARRIVRRIREKGAQNQRDQTYLRLIQNEEAQVQILIDHWGENTAAQDGAHRHLAIETYLCASKSKKRTM